MFLFDEIVELYLLYLWLCDLSVLLNYNLLLGFACALVMITGGFESVSFSDQDLRNLCWFSVQ